jgi:hypothetical protein
LRDPYVSPAADFHPDEHANTAGRSYLHAQPDGYQHPDRRTAYGHPYRYPGGPNQHSYSHGDQSNRYADPDAVRHADRPHTYADRHTDRPYSHADRDIVQYADCHVDIDRNVNPDRDRYPE